MSVMAFWTGSVNMAGFLFWTAIAGGVLSVVYLLRAWLRLRREARVQGGGDAPGIVAKAVVAGAGLMVDGKNFIAQTRKSSILQEPVPYGVAIAVGGVYVFVSIAVHLG